MQIVSACLFARGSNDSSHGAGPFALVYALFVDGSAALKGKPLKSKSGPWPLAVSQWLLD